MLNRRQFVLSLLAGTAAVGVGSTIWINQKSNTEDLTIDRALSILDKLMTQPQATLGEWNLGQILVHCAQSVEYSLYGFPEHKSELFKQTAGKLAFSIFASKGQMRHGLSEPIPGAPLLAKDTDLTTAYQRFRQSLLDFQQFTEQLQPHFAYGDLSNAEYEQAHVMHFYNHLLEIEAA